VKILVIAAAFPPLPVGEADHALHLCEHFVARGLDVHVLTTKRDAQRNDYRFALHPIMRGWQWSDLPRFTGFLRRCAPDAVLLMYTARDYNHSDMITFAPTITKAVLPSGARFVTQFLTDLIGAQGSVVARAIRKAVATCVGPKALDYVFGTLLCKSDHLVVLSERHLTALSNQFPGLNGKGIVIPPPPLLRMAPENNGATRQGSRQALGVKPDDFLIAYYGYLYKEKGIETLIKAFSIIRSERRNTRLVMIGGNVGETDGGSYVDAINSLAKDLGIANEITWTGKYDTNSDEASRYLRAADACVFPFNYGVTLNRSSVAAAAAHGVPIVTTKGSTLESAFIDGENVFLCAPEDAASVARAVGLLISNAGLRDRLRVGALKLAQDYFSWEKTVNRTIEALRA
jgi:glycosyltransferase involved in cell wall biosynthesis